MKLVASLLQLPVLIIFSQIARNPRETEAEIKGIKGRKKAEALSQQNRDGVSELLYTHQELTYLFRVLPKFLEDMQELLLQWSDQIVKVALSAEGKPRLRRR